MSHGTSLKQTRSKKLDGDRRETILLGTKNAGFIYVECVEENLGDHHKGFSVTLSPKEPRQPIDWKRNYKQNLTLHSFGAVTGKSLPLVTLLIFVGGLYNHRA